MQSERAVTGSWSFFLSLAAVLSFDLILGPYSVYPLFDTLQTIGVRYSQTARVFLEHGFQGWDPYTWCGLPVFVGARHPFSARAFIQAATPMWFFFILLKLTMVTCSALGTHRLLSEYFKVRREISLFVVCAGTMLSGYGMMIVTMLYCFPLVFMFGVDVMHGRGSLAIRLGQTAVVVAIFSAASPVFVIPYFIPLSYLLTFFAPPELSRARLFWGFSVLWVSFLLVFAPQVWALYDMLPVVNRTEVRLEASSWSLAKRTFTAALEQFRDPMLMLAMCGYGGLAATRRNRRLAALYILLCLLVIFTRTPFYDILLGGTFLHKAHLMRISLLLSVAGAIVAGVGLGAMRELPQRAWLFPLISSVACFLSSSEGLALQRTCMFAVLFLILRHMLVQREAFRRPMAMVVGFLLLLGFMLAKQNEILGDDAYGYYRQGYGNHNKLREIAEEQKGGPFRVANIDLHPSLSKSYGIETVDSKDELTYATFQDFMRVVAEPQFVSRELACRYFTNQLKLYLTPQQNSRLREGHVLNPGVARSAADFNLALLTLLDVRYLLSSKPVDGLEGFAQLKAVDDGEGFPLLRGTAIDRNYRLPIHVYELHAPLGRAFFVGGAAVFPDGPQALRAMASVKPKELRERAFFVTDEYVASGLTLLMDSPPAKGRVTITAYTPDAMTLRVSCDGPGFVVIANNYDKNWTAEVDGVHTPLVRANHTLQAVPLTTAGDHELQLRYASPILTTLVRLSLAGLLLPFALLLLPPTAGQVDGVQFQHPQAQYEEEAWRGLDPRAGVGLALLTTVVWGAMYILFVMRRDNGDGTPYLYALAMCPLFACINAIWWMRLLRLLRK